MSFIPSMVMGVAAGVLTAFGLGGGSLMMLALSAFTDWQQQSIAGLGLLFFLATSLSALPVHGKEGQLEPKTAWPAMVTGTLFGALSAWIALGLDTALLHRVFGGFMILVGLSELFRKDMPTDEQRE